MKKLEELGISPAPWFINEYGEVFCHYVRNTRKRERVVAAPNFYFGEHIANARLIAAAPKMYSAGRDLLTALEGWMRLYPPSEWSTMGQWFQLLEEAQDELRSAIAEAAGEEVSNGQAT